MGTDAKGPVTRAAGLTAGAVVLLQSGFCVAMASWLVLLADEVVGPTQRQLPDVGKVAAYAMAVALIVMGTYLGARSCWVLLTQRPVRATLRSVPQPSERFRPASVAYAIVRAADGATLPRTRLQRFGLRSGKATEVVVWSNPKGTWTVVVGSQAVWLPSSLRPR